MKAREFLAHEKKSVEERHLLKNPLSEAELKVIAKKLGGARELIAPKRKAEIEAMQLSDAQLLKHFAENPNHLRRPLIDLGSTIIAGFNAAAQSQLAARLR